MGARLRTAPARLALLALLALLARPVTAGAADAGEPPDAVAGHVSWASGTFDVTITRPLDPGTDSTIRAKGDAETEIASHISDLLVQAISPLIVDSSHTFGGLLQSDPSLFAKVADLLEAAPRAAVSLSPDFSSLVVQYSLPLFGPQGIVSPLFPAQESPLRRRLGYVATRRFTGLLIYAQEPLPEVGTGRMVVARPAVFPRLWDEQMNLVLDKSMCQPESLAQGGMVGYAQGPGDDVVALRAGPLPLRLAARGVFGDNATDLVLPTDGVMRLLTLPDNIALLRACRIVVIYNSLK